MALLDKIVRTAHVSDTTPLVIEVGPGPGLLSRSILDAGAKKVIAIEKDDRFMPTLHVKTTYPPRNFDSLKINTLFL
jgi:dimethyladenosine transferase 1